MQVIWLVEEQRMGTDFQSVLISERAFWRKE